MSTFQQQYKIKKPGFGDINNSRRERIEEYKESRKQRRIETFNKTRNLLNTTWSPPNKEVQPVAVVKNRRFLKWKFDRERRKKDEKAKKKPPFIVGVVHHKLYSPVSVSKPIVSNVRRELVPKRITRATEKRLINKTHSKKETVKKSAKNPAVINKEQHYDKKPKQSFAPEGYKFKGPTGLPQEPLFGRVVTESMSPAQLSKYVHLSARRSRRSRKSGRVELGIKHENNKNNIIIDKNRYVNKTEDDNKETVPLKLSFNDKKIFNSSNDSSNNNNNKNADVKANNNKLHSKNALDASPVANPKIETISAESISSCEPAFFSPYVVSSRGKSSARKEQQLKRGFSLGQSPKNVIPTKETVMNSLNTSVEVEERTAQYFQFLLNKEVARLKELCKKWTKIQIEPDTTEDGQYEINQAVGQTNLLMNKKFERFRKLVADCETGKGTMLVTCKDLQGFWDMMYIEVQNCDLRFEKLERLRSHNWEEKELHTNKPTVRKNTTIKTKVLSTKPSSIRTFLAEKKKKLADGIKNGNNNVAGGFVPNQNQIPKNTYKKTKSLNTSYKTRKSKSISYEQNKFTPIKLNKRLSLLQKMQQPEASSVTKSPLTVMKISRLCKTQEIQSGDTELYLNFDKTPAKSILKQSSSSEAESDVKTKSKVNFKQDQIKMETSVMLSRINSFELDDPNDVIINAERKLTFEDNSFENLEDGVKKVSKLENFTDKSIQKTPSIQVQMDAQLQEINKNHNTPLWRRRIRRQNAISMEDEMLIETSNPASFKEITDDVELNSLEKKLKKHVFISDTEELNVHDTSIKVLRNRTIVSADTPRAKRSSKRIIINVHESEHEEDATPSRRRRSSFKVIDNKGINILNNADNVRSSNKRSTRSVKFYDTEDYSDITNKKTLPVTPHAKAVRRSYSKRRSTITDNSVSLEMPKRFSERIRRSQGKQA